MVRRGSGSPTSTGLKNLTYSRPYLESSRFLGYSSPQNMQNVEKPNASIPVMRHFDDVDDILNFERDGDLIPGQEDKAIPIAQEIYTEAKKKENKSSGCNTCATLSNI